MDGMDRSIVLTMRRSSGKAETSRVTRMSRASRATIANAPAWGRSDGGHHRQVEDVPAVAGRTGRGGASGPTSRIAISITKIVWTTVSATSKSQP